MGRNTKYKMQAIDIPVYDPIKIPGITVPRINYEVSVGGRNRPENGATKGANWLTNLVGIPSDIFYNLENNLDDIANGTSYAKVLSTDISDGHILLSSVEGNLDNVDDGTNYGRILLTGISAGKIVLAQVEGDLDDIADGSSYGKVAITAISAGNILLASTIEDDTYKRYLASEKTKLAGIAEGATTDAALNDFISDVYTGEISSLQNQIDGVVMNWFYEGEPTLINLPASDWTTNELKDEHLGDLYYDLLTGYAYRFLLSGTYQWYLVPDADVAAALAAAAAAQDTADGKRRVFTDTPTTPYDVGDLWLTSLTASLGDLKKCITARSGGAYVAADWVVATKYTEGAAWGSNLSGIPADIFYKLSNSLDDIPDGATYGKVNITNISAGNILLASVDGTLDDVTDGENYGKILLTSLSAGRIVLAEVDGTMDDLAEGDTYGKVALTDISSGHILLQVNQNLGEQGIAIVTATTGARLELMPDANNGLVIIDDDGNDVIRAIIGGADIGDLIIGNYTGNQGVKYDKSANTFDVAAILKTQSGSIINGTYVDSLVVDKLAAGDITSKAIILAVEDGEGDSYFGGGNALDLVNWVGGDDNGGAVLFGIDDSDSNKGKLFAGNYHLNKYFRFDGTNADVTGLRYLEIFTAGEDINAGEPVSLGHGQGYDQETQHDAYQFASVAQRVPDQNYHDVAMNVGLERPLSTTYHKYGLINFYLDEYPENFLDFFVYLNCTTGATGGTGMLMDVYPITSDWDPTTVTWNTLPTFDTNYVGSFTIDHGSNINWYGAGGTLLNWIMRCKLGLETFRGFLIQGHSLNTDNGSTNINVGDDKPGMRGRRLVDTNKVYASKSAIIEETYGSPGQEYRCYNFIGFAVESVSAGDPVRVQTSGIVGGLSDLIPGSDYYISNSGGQIDTAQDLTAGFPMYKIGVATSATTLLIEKGEKSCILGSISGYIPTYFTPKSVDVNIFFNYNSQTYRGIYVNQYQYPGGYLFYYAANTNMKITHILPGGLFLTALHQLDFSCLGIIKG